MKILFIAAEDAPLVKVGGLADVVGSLPQALQELGHDVRIVLPKYDCLDTTKYSSPYLQNSFQIKAFGNIETISLETATTNDNIPIFLIGNQKYFSGKPVYGGNELERFFFFSRAISQIMPALCWQPNVVHCHDWHTALVPMFLKKSDSPYATLFTIHNLAYQGLFDDNFMDRSGLRPYWKDWPPDAPEARLSFMSQGILQADIISTVSENYAREIMMPENGAGLDALLRYRGKDVIGIINGINLAEYDPRKDPYLRVRYDSHNIKGKIDDKTALQQEVGLPTDTSIPLIGMVQRLDEQKGLDIIEKGIEIILSTYNVQFVIQGTGRELYEDTVRRIAARYPQKVAAITAFDTRLAHLIYAGADMFLMPSRFEPCGLGQMIAMHYGTIPIVRHTGGLVDTVPAFNRDLSTGNGFVFYLYTSEDMAKAIFTAVEIYHQQKTNWEKAVKRIMQLDFSWQSSARKYDFIYQSLMIKKPKAAR